MRYMVFYSAEFEMWYKNKSIKEQLQISKRVYHIEKNGYFGDHQFIDTDLWELRWKNGRRIYYTEIVSSEIVLLCGGNKNGQKQDIQRARNIKSKRRH